MAQSLSVPDVPLPPEPPPRRPTGKSGSHGCLSVILALIGIILLLPGICSVIYMTLVLRPGVDPGGLGTIWAMTFLVAAGGIALIVWAVWRR